MISSRLKADDRGLNVSSPQPQSTHIPNISPPDLRYYILNFYKLDEEKNKEKTLCGGARAGSSGGGGGGGGGGWGGI
ncbi:hypothetical protein E2C01_024448 [Portunus trituberculatus]|uniref:Uncharacterized protein n=1 Tax=Portunus trituberculatus TaxID=210409 RepID=A0A5B7ECU9_PORTR|nr:hypothetical protein [Portunus trituberculatus]